jgi:hypothetical protein
MLFQDITQDAAPVAAAPVDSLAARLTIPSHLLTHSPYPTLHVAYERYKGCLEAQDILTTLVEMGEWSSRVPILEEVLKLFVPNFRRAPGTITTSRPLVRLRTIPHFMTVLSTRMMHHWPRTCSALTNPHTPTPTYLIIVLVVNVVDTRRRGRMTTVVKDRLSRQRRPKWKQGPRRWSQRGSLEVVIIVGRE